MDNYIIILGIAISLIFYEIVGLSPAGIIVPGYIALCINTPERIAYTVIIAAVAWGGLKLFDNFIIVYGRRRFALLIVFSFLINMFVTETGIVAFNIGIIGNLVPGIMANEFARQGFIPTIASLATVVCILILIMMLGNVPVLT